MHANIYLKSGPSTNRYCEKWLVSIKVHQNTDERVKLFAKFLGLDNNYEHLPVSMFRYYVAIIKKLNFDPKNLFAKVQKGSLKIPYIKVLGSFKQ